MSRSFGTHKKAQTFSSGSSKSKKNVARTGIAMAVAASLAIGAGGYALADGLTQVDPGTVPYGELALKNHVVTPFRLKVGHGHQHNFVDGAEVTVEHFALKTGESTGWHSHAGPVFVEVVGRQLPGGQLSGGQLTVYEKSDPGCRPHVYGPGTGFVEEAGDVHLARNEGNQATDIYVQYILPSGSGDAGIFQPADNSNPHCPSAK